MPPCKSCSAPIEFAIGPNGKWMPFDAPTPAPRDASELRGPTAAGQYAIVDGVAHAYTLEDLRLHRPRYISHFATCPKASNHRAPRPAASSSSSAPATPVRRGRQCVPLDFGNGATGFMCGTGLRDTKPCGEPGCSDPSVALCDWPLAGKRAGRTCSRPLCARHRALQPPNPDGSQRDYCPAHHRLSQAQGSLL